jgi:spore germination cell wall hydrolase CwlJ-like protein
MIKYLCLSLVYLLLAACSTTKTLPVNEDITRTDHIQSVHLNNSVSVDTIVQTVSPEEKYSILSLFEMVKNELQLDPDPEELKCMADAMYFEARGEGREGMVAVGYVIMNRMSDSRFPSTVCGVTKQGKYVNGKPVRNRCQFSWFCDGISDIVKDIKAYILATDLATSVLTGRMLNPIGNSLYYHEISVRPRWSRVFLKTRRLGRHVFYYA